MAACQSRPNPAPHRPLRRWEPEESRVRRTSVQQGDPDYDGVAERVSDPRATRPPGGRDAASGSRPALAGEAMKTAPLSPEEPGVLPVVGRCGSCWRRGQQPGLSCRWQRPCTPPAGGSTSTSLVAFCLKDAQAPVRSQLRCLATLVVLGAAIGPRCASPGLLRQALMRQHRGFEQREKFKAIPSDGGAPELTDLPVVRLAESGKAGRAIQGEESG